MPRLGHDDALGENNHSPIASAYSTPNAPLSAPRLVIIFFGLFMLKNVLFHVSEFVSVTLWRYVAA